MTRSCAETVSYQSFSFKHNENKQLLIFVLIINSIQQVLVMSLVKEKKNLFNFFFNFILTAESEKHVVTKGFFLYSIINFITHFL